MQRRAFLLVLSTMLLSVLVAACNAEGGYVIEHVFDACEPLVLEPESSVTDEQLDSVLAGADAWNNRADTLLFIAPEGPEDAPVVPVRFEDAAPVFLGHYDDEGVEVLINSGLEPELARATTVAHELGHVFGLYHIEPHERRSVINPGVVDLLPTEADVRDLRGLWGDCRERQPE